MTFTMLQFLEKEFPMLTIVDKERCWERISLHSIDDHPGRTERQPISIDDVIELQGKLALIQLGNLRHLASKGRFS